MTLACLKHSCLSAVCVCVRVCPQNGRQDFELTNLYEDPILTGLEPESHIPLPPPRTYPKINQWVF